MNYGEMPTWMRNILTDLSEDGRRGGARNVGDRWRFIEGPYPDRESESCLQLQFREGTYWTTKWALRSNGENWASCRVSYYLTAAMSVVNGATPTIINYDTKTYDTDDMVVTGASWALTVPGGKDGLYHVSCGYDLAAVPAGVRTDLLLYVNNALFRRLAYNTNTSAAPQNQGMWSSADVWLEEDDVLNVRGLHSGGAGIAVNPDATNKQNYITVCRIPL